MQALELFECVGRLLESTPARTLVAVDAATVAAGTGAHEKEQLQRVRASLFVSVSPSVVSARLSSSSGSSHVGSSSISDGRLISSSLRKMRARACVCRSSRERRAENTTISRNKEGEHEEKSRYTLSLSFSSNWPVLAQPRLASLIIIMIIMLRLCYCYTRAYTALAHT